jgi:hypothetical protein
LNFAFELFSWNLTPNHSMIGPMRALTLVLALLSTPGLAQQSLFNVPSTQETLPGRLFGQVQLTGTSHGGEVNTTLELGVFRWLEVGMNIFRMPLYRLSELDPGAPAQSSTMLNANVYLDPLAWLAFEAGVQGGIGFVPNTTRLEPVVFGWVTSRFEAPAPFGSYVVGAYSGNRGALGRGPPVGGLLGVEVPVIEHRLHAMADWVVGLNDLSVVVVGAVVFIGQSFQLSAGAQLPSPGSGNSFGGMLELTYVPVPAQPGEGLGHPADRPQRRKPVP